jgi:hypothetical protein
MGAEPRIELRPALQQADVLATELRRTMNELCRILLSYSTPQYTVFIGKVSWVRTQAEKKRAGEKLSVIDLWSIG